MIRLLLRLFGIRDYEVCASCETLKQQLAYEREEKQRLTDTLLAIVHPKVVEQPIVEMNPVVQSAGLFSRRRAALEEADRQKAKILKESKHIGQPDNSSTKHMNENSAFIASGTIESLEKELGVEEKEA